MPRPGRAWLSLRVKTAALGWVSTSQGCCARQLQDDRFRDDASMGSRATVTFAARSRSHRSVLPSMSVKRKVTVSDGRSGMVRFHTHSLCSACRLSHDQQSVHVREDHHRIIRLTPVYGTGRGGCLAAHVGCCGAGCRGLIGEQRSESSGAKPPWETWFRYPGKCRVIGNRGHTLSSGNGAGTFR